MENTRRGDGLTSFALTLPADTSNRQIDGLSLETSGQFYLRKFHFIHAIYLIAYQAIEMHMLVIMLFFTAPFGTNRIIGRSILI